VSIILVLVEGNIKQHFNLEEGVRSQLPRIGHHHGEVLVSVD